MQKLLLLLAIAAGLALAHVYLGLPLPTIGNQGAVVDLMIGVLMVVGAVVVITAVYGWLTGKEKASTPLILKIFHVILVLMFVLVLYYIFQAVTGNKFITFR